MKNKFKLISHLLPALLLSATALVSPLIANEKPLVMRFSGKLYFPAAYDYPLISVPPELNKAGFRDVMTFRRKFAGDDATWMLMPPIPYSANTIDLDAVYARPGGAGHVLGADKEGRDTAARLLHGIKISLSIGLVAVGIAFVIGIIAGAVAGYFGGWIDIAISRLMEVVVSIPLLLLLLILIAALEEPTIYHTMVIIGLVSWVGIARIFRGEVLKIRSLDFVTASHSLGSRLLFILGRHIFPNAIAPVLVSVTFGIASAILTESMLSFLGFGDPNFPSWGEIIDQGRRHTASWHLVVFPGVAIFYTVTVFNLLGDAMRDAIDPKMAVR